MKRIGKLFLALCLVSTFFFAGGFELPAEASTQPMIKIGVVPEAEHINIGSSGGFVIKNKVTGAELLSGENEDVQVSLDATAEVRTNWRLQVAFSTNNAFIADWVHRAEMNGYPTYLEEYLNGYRLLIGEFPANASFAVRNAFREEVIAKGLAWSDSFWRQITLIDGVAALKITHGQAELISTDPILIEAADLVRINGRPYRGMGEISFNSRGTLVGINTLPIEEYLYGVVPRELPPVPYGELEAQKAQAVAARTYALANLGKRSSDGYDLLPTTSDQVYGGYAAEHPISTQAVQETHGVVATYNGRLITAVYHSTSGGFTANNEDIWSSEAVPYLRGVPDAERGKALQHVPSLEVFKNHRNPKSLRAAHEGDYEADWSRYHRWTFEWSAEEMTQVVSSYFNTPVGKVLEVNVLERSDSGRVLELEIVTENGVFYEYKDRVRWALQTINANGSRSVLLSTLFYIEPVTDRQTKEVTGFVVYGGGWGHGVGLSQTGAVGMATKGYSYEDILKHYYQGIALEVRY